MFATTVEKSRIKLRGIAYKVSLWSERKGEWFYAVRGVDDLLLATGRIKGNKKKTITDARSHLQEVLSAMM